MEQPNPSTPPVPPSGWPVDPPHPSNWVTLDNVGELFGYRKPTPDTIPRYEAINGAAVAFAQTILRLAPNSRWVQEAIGFIVQARMFANAVIATVEPAYLSPLSGVQPALPIPGAHPPASDAVESEQRLVDETNRTIRDHVSAAVNSWRELPTAEHFNAAEVGRIGDALIEIVDEHRRRAIAWMDTAAQATRNADYWRALAEGRDVAPSVPPASVLDTPRTKETWPAMRNDLIARGTHEMNRLLCLALGDASQVHWEDTPEWQRDSAALGVQKALLGATGETLHESWAIQKVREGWIYGPTKDPEAKRHPCLVPYSHLPEGQKRKDNLFAQAVFALDHVLPLDWDYLEGMTRAEYSAGTLAAAGNVYVLELRARPDVQVGAPALPADTNAGLDGQAADALARDEAREAKAAADEGVPF